MAAVTILRQWIGLQVQGKIAGQQTRSCTQNLDTICALREARELAKACFSASIERSDTYIGLAVTIAGPCRADVAPRSCPSTDLGSFSYQLVPLIGGAVFVATSIDGTVTWLEPR